MENNAQTHKHHYNMGAREELGLKKFIWSFHSPDLNTIEIIWKKYPVEYVTNHVM